MYQPSNETLINSILAYLDDSYISGGGIDHAEGVVYYISDTTDESLMFCWYDLISMQEVVTMYDIPLIY